MDLTFEDFKENIDKIATLYELLSGRGEYDSEETTVYLNSPAYKSPIYDFLVHLSEEQRDILNFALVIGYWISLDEDDSYESYLKDLNSQEINIKDTAGWCSRIVCCKNSPYYLKTFLDSFKDYYIY